jgi:short-subunit dehydrogenase
MSFAGQVALLTGASSGIGQALARALAADGCKVGLLARRREPLEALVAEITRANGVAAFAVADVQERVPTVAALRDLAARLGEVDLLVANAGVGIETRLQPFNVEAMEKVIRVNLLGVLYAIEAVLPDMLRRGCGHLAAVSSLGAYKGLPGSQAYCASKAAINTFMEGLRIQLHGSGIAVTTICPGFVRTPMTQKNSFAMPWLMEPDAAARRIVGALKRRVKVYNFPWQMTLLMKLTRWAPDGVLAWLTRRNPRGQPTFPDGA